MPLPTVEEFQETFQQQSSWVGWRSPYVEPAFERIHQSLVHHHRVPPLLVDLGPQEVNHWKLGLLHDMAYHVFQWHHANRHLPDHPLMADVKRFLVRVQEAHRDEVAVTVANGFPLWTPDRDDLLPDDLARLDSLWSSVTTGHATGGRSSSLRVFTRTLDGRGSGAQEVAGAKEQFDALHARLLAGPAGRRLVGDLVDSAFTVHLRPAHTTDEGNYGYVQAGLTPLNSPQAQEEKDRAASAVEDLSLPSGWRPGTGVECRIVMNRGLTDATLQHRDDTGNDLDRTSANQVLSPAFIVYGHELGHARNNVRGERKTKLRRHLYDDHLISRARVERRIALGVNNRVPPHEEQLFNWHNLEEHDVIENVENALRDEHGLTRRKWH